VSGTIPGALLLVVSIVALGAAALRVASLAAPAGLERVVAAAPLFVAAAVAEALAFGTVGLAGSGLALAAAAVVTWGLVARLTPRPQTPILPDLAAGALAAGLLGGWALWALRYPYLGLDGSTYHLSTVAEWVRQGTTGHSLDLYVRVPVGSYPLTWETSLAWAVGAAHSFAPVALWSAATVGLLAAAGWLGLRALQVPRAIVALALPAVCLIPVALRGLVHSETDMPALAWLAVAAALTVRARARPALLPIAIVAAALAIGTKTTTVPLAGIVVVVGLWQARRQLRGLALPLTAAAVALGVVAGGVWYVRNLVAHGSPGWPFVSTSWGDPVPPLFERVNYSLLDRPRATLVGQWDTYRVALSGGIVLAAGGLLAPLWARRREVIGAAAATLVATIAWASAPFTGAGAAPFLQVNTLRYAVPAMAAGAVALALSARSGRWARWWVALVLLVAIGWSAKAYLDDTYLPAEGVLALAAIAGAAVAFVLRRRPTTAAAAGLAGLFLLAALGGRHYVERHALAHDFDSALVQWFTENPSWRAGSAPIAFSPTTSAPLAGNRLRHPLSVIPADEPCALVTGRLAHGWVVVRDVDRNLFGSLAAERCLARTKPVFTDGIHRVYGPHR
jgi:hypothetical protein